MNRSISSSSLTARSPSWRRLSGLCAGGALLLSLFASSADAVPLQTDWKKIKAAPLRDFKPQQPTRIQLDNGLVIFLQPNPELPLITVLGDIKGGSGDEPADKVSLTSLYTATLRSGGIQGKTGDQVDDFLAARAAQKWAAASISSS